MGVDEGRRMGRDGAYSMFWVLIKYVGHSSGEMRSLIEERKNETRMDLRMFSCRFIWTYWNDGWREKSCRARLEKFSVCTWDIARFVRSAYTRAKFKVQAGDH